MLLTCVRDYAKNKGKLFKHKKAKLKTKELDGKMAMVPNSEKTLVVLP
jgi:hypothetical protein